MNNRQIALDEILDELNRTDEQIQAPTVEDYLSDVARRIETILNEEEN